jgi:signal transduction histidine kinase
MTFWNSQSIAGKLTRVNLIVCGTALILAYVSFLFYDVYTLRGDLIKALGTEASIVGSNSVAALLFDDPQTAESTLSALRGSPQVVSAIVFGPNGQVFARYDRNPSNQPAVMARLTPGQLTGYWTDNSDRVLYGRKITSQNTVIGSVYILAETTDLVPRARQFGLISAGILLLCFVIALFVTSAVRNLVSRPLTELAETARIVSRDRDYSVRAETPAGSDELALLVRSFNSMLEQIQVRDFALEESRRGLEQKIQERTAELVEANRELEAFSYSVAHDLRGPLQQITSLAFLVQSSGDIHLVDKLIEGTERMSSLIDDLLNLSRATSLPLHYRAIDLSRMVQSTFEPLMADKGDRAVHITVAAGACAYADEGLIGLVLENLIGNAWKYSSRRNPAHIEFGFREEESQAVFFVRDNGVGFNPNFADRLFRPFQRLHSQGDFPGTGVGLATVQRIVARHGGRVWAKGSIDHGAEFSFTLPYRPHPPGPPLSGFEATTSGRLRIEPGNKAPSESG